MDEKSKLQELLATWKVQAPTSANFRTQVWSRVEAQKEEAQIGGFLRLHVKGMLLASVLTVGVSGLFGYSAAQAHDREQSRELASKYVATLDGPYHRTLSEALH